MCHVLLNLEAAGLIRHFSLRLHHALQRLPVYMSNSWLKPLKQLGHLSISETVCLCPRRLWGDGTSSRRIQEKLCPFLVQPRDSQPLKFCPRWLTRDKAGDTECSMVQDYHNSWVGTSDWGAKRSTTAKPACLPACLEPGTQRVGTK